MNFTEPKALSCANILGALEEALNAMANGTACTEASLTRPLFSATYPRPPEYELVEAH